MRTALQRIARQDLMSGGRDKSIRIFKYPLRLIVFVHTRYRIFCISLPCCLPIKVRSSWACYISCYISGGSLDTRLGAASRKDQVV